MMIIFLNLFQGFDDCSPERAEFLVGGGLKFDLGTEVRPEVSTTTQRRRKIATYI